MFETRTGNRIVFALLATLIAGSLLLWRNVDEAAIDRGLVDGFGRVAIQLSLFTRVFQNGRVSRYAAYVVFGAIVMTALVAIFSMPSVLSAVQNLPPGGN